MPNLVKNELLKPVQITPLHQDSQQIPNKSIESTPELFFNINQLESSAKIDQSTSLSSNSLITSPAFELDLSYFENKLDQKSTKPLPTVKKSSSNDDFLSDIHKNTTNSLKTHPQHNDSKVYLDKLLKDIFVNCKNDTKDTNISSLKNNKKDDEIQSDKKCKFKNRFKFIFLIFIP